jgi:hypothetical protein
MPLVLEKYELCLPEEKIDHERITQLINGEPRATGWSPIRMKLVTKDLGKNLRASDSPWYGSHALIFRKHARAVLSDLLNQYGELLELSCQEAELVVFNPTRVLDALDEEKASVERFSSGRIMIVNRYVFRREVIQDIDIFKIRSLRVSPTFVGPRFVESWRSAGLDGLEFRPVWSSG